MMARLNGIQCSLQRNYNYVGLKRLEKKLLTELSELLKREELMWFQREK